MYSTSFHPRVFLIGGFFTAVQKQHCTALNNWLYSTVQHWNSTALNNWRKFPHRSNSVSKSPWGFPRRETHPLDWLGAPWSKLAKHDMTGIGNEGLLLPLTNSTGPPGSSFWLRGRLCLNKGDPAQYRKSDIEWGCRRTGHLISAVVKTGKETPYA